MPLSFGLDEIKQMKTKHLFSFSTKPKHIAFSFRLAGTKQMEFYNLVLKQNKQTNKIPLSLYPYDIGMGERDFRF